MVSVPDDLRGMERWRESEGERDEVGDRKGVVWFVCKILEVMYGGVLVKRTEFEMLQYKFCKTSKRFYCLSFAFFS